MNKEELIKKVAEKIYYITGKDDSRTVQNWIDAEEIMNMIFEYCKKRRENRRKAQERKKN